LLGTVEEKDWLLLNLLPISSAGLLAKCLELARIDKAAKKRRTAWKMTLTFRLSDRGNGSIAEVEEACRWPRTIYMFLTVDYQQEKRFCIAMIFVRWRRKNQGVGNHDGSFGRQIHVVLYYLGTYLPDTYRPMFQIPWIYLPPFER
jgi:hypothetical protein